MAIMEFQERDEKANNTAKKMEANEKEKRYETKKRMEREKTQNERRNQMEKCFHSKQTLRKVIPSYIQRWQLRNEDNKI